jgi:hypothetical protein
MLNGALPIDGNGVLPLPSQGTKPIIKQFLDHRGITPEIMQDHLTDFFFKFIQAMVDQDKEKILKMSERRFGEKLVSNLSKAGKNHMTFERGEGLIRDLIKEDTNDYGEYRANLVGDFDQTYTVDTLLIKGISPIRADNDSNFDYKVLKQHD